MTGLSGSLCTSATGAKSQSKPSACSRRAVTPAIQRIVSASAARASVAAFGRHHQVPGELRHPAALLVQRHEQPPRPCQLAQARNDPPRIGEVLEVARGEQDHARGRELREVLLPRGREAVGWDSDHHAASDHALGVHARPTVGERSAHVNAV
jgi:hypothetical protein